MKVILLQDVAGIGQKHDIKHVSDGYAANFLFPRKFAEAATMQSLQKVEAEKMRKQAEAALRAELLQKTLGELSQETFSIVRKAAPEGHLFAGIHKEDIATLLRNEKNIDIPADIIELEKPIKETGSHKIPISSGGKRVVLTLVVEASL